MLVAFRHYKPFSDNKLTEMAKKTKQKGVSKKKPFIRTSGRAGPVIKLCERLGYSRDKSSERNYTILRKETAAYRKIWVQKHGENSGNPNYEFPSQHWAEDVQQCVDDFLNDPKYLFLFEKTQDLLDAGKPTLATNEAQYNSFHLALQNMAHIPTGSDQTWHSCFVFKTIFIKIIKQSLEQLLVLFK